MAAGANASDIEGLAAEAKNWFAEHTNGLPAGVSRSSAAGNRATQIADVLAHFNQGVIGPGRCSQ